MYYFLFFFVKVFVFKLNRLRILDCLFLMDYFSLNKYMDGMIRSDLYCMFVLCMFFYLE